jgi:hypothetical protein
MKPTERSFLEAEDEEDAEDEEEDREVFILGWMTAVYWRGIIEGILVEFLRMERVGEAVVTVGAKVG